MRAFRLLLTLLLGMLLAPGASGLRAQPTPLTLGITVNRPTIAPGDTLVAGVTVNNPGSGPLADFYFLILLPDGATMVSAGPGVGARFGTLGNLRSLVPVARGISLANAFPYQADPFFSYTFSGIEPEGTYRFYFVALRSGALDNGALDAGEVLALQTETFVFTTVPGNPTVTIDETAVLLPQLGATRQLSATARDGFGRPVADPITWTSTRPDQVDVDGAGVVRAGVANGSSQITAHVAGVSSAPLLVIATAAAPGATLVTDAEIVGPPVETTPAAPPSVNNTYTVVLRGVPPPAVGALLINTGSQPVAGRVLAVAVAGADTTVTLGLATLPELFPDLVIDEILDLANAPIAIDPSLDAAYRVARAGNTFTFTPRPGASVSPAADRSQSPLVGTRALFPYTCETDVGLPVQLSTPPIFSVTVSPTLDLRYTPTGGLQRFIVRAQPTVKVEGGITLTAAFEGKVTCTVDLFVYRVPVGGPLSMVISGLVPVGVGFELSGKLTVATLGLSVKEEATTNLAIGVECIAPAGCAFHKALTGSSLTFTPTLDAPSIGDVRLEPSLSTFGFVKASIGNPLFTSLRFDAFQAKVGGKLEASFASPTSQMADATYRSDYKLSLFASATVGRNLGDVATMLGLSSITAIELASTTVVAASPAPAAANPVTADRESFTVGDIVNFRVRLDPATVNFFPGGGPYNVTQIVLVRGRANPTIATAVNAAPGQTEFSLPYAAPGPGTAGDFTAFVITTLVNRPAFALEIGRAAVDATIVVSPRTAVVSTGGNATFTATVTGLSSNQVVWSTDGGSISATGVYSAPTVAGTFRVRATSVVSPSVFGEASVFVQGGEGVTAAQVRLNTSTRSQGFTLLAPPIPPAASFTTSPAIEPEIGHANYTITGPIAGPLVDPANPLIIQTSQAMQVPGTTPLNQQRFSESLMTVRLSQPATFELQVDLTCSANIDCGYAALRITGPGFSIDEAARNISFPWAGHMEPGVYSFATRARVLNASGAGGASTAVTWRIIPALPAP